MPIQKHVHRLKRLKYKTGNSIYFCTLPDCHFKIECALALGKKAICNLCGDEFILNEYHIKLAKPHCDSCSKQKIKGADGKNYYVRKTTMQVLDTIAKDNASSLRDRLDSAVGLLNEDDI